MRMRWQILPVLLFLFLAACSAPKRATPPPASMTVSAGEQFDIRLPANPSTGFRWQVGSIDEKVVRLVDTRYDAKVTDAVGAGGTDIFSFVGVASGRGNIKLVYLRPWEKGVAPARTSDYLVEVL
ncbi:MAG: protease inhibitor I42 family protein [Candidatus Binatia bacterium]|nr:protease inhibitor I42 family protein [Candidatus Binatia bacterium]